MRDAPAKDVPANGRAIRIQFITRGEFGSSLLPGVGPAIDSIKRINP